MYIFTSLIIAILISSHIVNHNYCIYLHKISMEKTQLTIKNNLFDDETLYNSYIIYKIYILKKSKKLETSLSKTKTKSYCDPWSQSRQITSALLAQLPHTACGISSVRRLVPFAALSDRHCLSVCCCCGGCFRCCPP